MSRWSSSRAVGAVLLAIGLIACGDRRQPGWARTEPAGARDAGGDAAAVPPTGTATREPSGDDPGEDPRSDEVPGAIPPWQAVIDRDRYLARRRQSAVLIGRLGGEAIAPGARGVIRWLVDETDGNGALAVRVGFTGAVPADGTRLAVRGTWTLDSQRRWYWAVETHSELQGAGPPAGVDPAAPPGLVVSTAAPPTGYRAASRAKDGGVISFGVIRPPPRSGDGWLIGDNSFGAPIAILTLPGERESYGGHDLRQDDERWQLKRGTVYWLRIDKVRKRSDGRVVLRALTAPVKAY